jgi:hypothetical protein
MKEYNIDVSMVVSSDDEDDVSQREKPQHHHRRCSSVSFSDETEVVEFEKDVKRREKVWYTAEELNEIRHQCKLEARRTVNTGLERGLENLAPRGLPCGALSLRQYSRSVVLMEYSNQILEYGHLLDTERLAELYHRVAAPCGVIARHVAAQDASEAGIHSS